MIIEACNFIRKCFAKLSRRKFLDNLERATLQDPCDGVLFNEIAGINLNSRPGTSAKKKPPPRMFTGEYIRTFSVSTGRYYLSSAFLVKLRVEYYRTATLIRRWSIIGFFSQKITFFILSSFQYIFQKEAVVSSFYNKVAV